MNDVRKNFRILDLAPLWLWLQFRLNYQYPVPQLRNLTYLIFLWTYSTWTFCPLSVDIIHGWSLNTIIYF